MSRQPRVIKENVVYDCFSRCVEEKDLLKPDFAKRIVLQSIEAARGKYRFGLNEVALADNQMNIRIRTLKGGETISKIMQYIKSRTTEKYNRATGRSGPMWNARFKSVIIGK